MSYEKNNQVPVLNPARQISVSGDMMSHPSLGYRLDWYLWHLIFVSLDPILVLDSINLKPDFLMVCTFLCARIILLYCSCIQQERSRLTLMRKRNLVIITPTVTILLLKKIRMKLGMEGIMGSFKGIVGVRKADGKIRPPASRHYICAWEI